MQLAEVKITETFKIAGFEFIKFSDKDGVTVAVAKDCVFNSIYGSNNNFSKSKALDRLNNKILPTIEKAVGTENIIEFETDLLSLDGLNTHGKIKSKISLPTFDFYRNNVKIFDKHKLNNWWWLATPDTTKEHLNDYWTTCVSPYGSIINYDCNSNNGVRPILCFVSSISVSSDD
ncbi:MAG: hypothetical protein E7568_05600 [Ruminococcaceae bacterium]|nr:hypothetical protein [Oscillospiraceae bacterium]